jgi:SAM-dependent methyltransferase
MLTCRESSTALPEAAASASSPALRSLLLHAGSAPAGFALVSQWPALPWPYAAGLLAAAASLALSLPPWWVAINALFMPALALALLAQLPAPVWLAAFLVLALVYWGVARSRVPLFLSSDAAAQALAGLLGNAASPRFADLGCGDGRLLQRLARRLPKLRAFGIEYAPLPWLLARWRSRGLAPRCRIAWGSLWRLDLGEFDVVYAYLSPVPMADLWEKACREMAPGSLFISNSFAVPGVAAEREIVLGDGWGGVLYLYRVRG